MTEGQGFCPEPQRPHADNCACCYCMAANVVMPITLLIIIVAGLVLFFWTALQGGEGGTMPPQQHIHHEDDSSLTDWAQLITALTGLVAALTGAGLWARRRHIAKKGKL